ncbi:MAG TPA: hypothetical protein EYP59_21180 [Thiotrichaceae bacterium]|nr:hypothetical protein [Thiotrichaceae bacterium]
MQHDLGILVLSCDKFADLWKPFFTLFWQNYENNSPYPVYLGSNTVGYEETKIKTIYSGEDRDWSTSCRTILQQIPHKYILLLLEDFFITSKIDSVKITQSVQFMQENNAKHIHFRPTPKPDKWLPNQEIGFYEKRAPYRVNVAGFWDREYLLNLLIDGESPWNFEIQGSYRTAYDEGFYCLNVPLFSHVHVVEKGCWFPEAIAYCNEHNIVLELDKRPVLSNLTRLKSKLQMYYFNLMIKVPWKFRVKCMDILRKLLISY